MLRNIARCQPLRTPDGRNGSPGRTETGPEAPISRSTFCSAFRENWLRQFSLLGEEVKRSTDSFMEGLIKVGAKVAHHGRRWYVHEA